MENETVKNLLNRIICEGCITHTKHGDLMCFYCEGPATRSVYGACTANHEPDCIYLLVHKTLTETKTK